MEIKYVTKNGRVLAMARIKNKAFAHIGDSQQKAYDGLMQKIMEPKFGQYDMDAPTSVHNSSVRTRV